MERLRRVMRARGVSQAQLALRVDVSQPTISRILAGENVPAVDVAARLAQTLGVSLDWLCDLPERQAGALPPDEDELLALYRAMSEVGQGLTLDMARVVAERAQAAAHST